MSCALKPVPYVYPHRSAVYGIWCCACARFTPTTPTNITAKHVGCPCFLNINCNRCKAAVRYLYWQCWCCDGVMRGYLGVCNTCGFAAEEIGNVWFYGYVREEILCSEYGGGILPREPSTMVSEGWRVRHRKHV